MVVLDTLEKTAGIRMLQAELNDQPGVCLKIVGPLADVEAAVAAGERLVRGMEIEWISDIIPAPDPRSGAAYEAAPEFNPLIEQAVVHIPRAAGDKEDKRLSDQSPFAVGFIETQGFTAVFEAIDTACKTANVEVLAREKLGGGYIAVMIKGDVAAVRAAIEAGRTKVEGLGRLIAAHVIPSPSKQVMSLVPK